MKTSVEFEGFVIRLLAELQGLAEREVDPRASFRGLGLDSLGASRLAARLSEALGRPLSPTLVWEFPTISALARHLAGAPGAADGGAAAATSEDPGEPIAIIGVACRVPGAASPAAFWELLAGGVDAVRHRPPRRWLAGLEAMALSAEDRALIGHGGFLDDVAGFDSYFFGLSPREARAMDPQQRLALELTWEALADAGVRPTALAGSRTGVFAAAIWSDYATVLERAGVDALDPYSVTGWHHSIIANRISYLLGLGGPSFTLDAACSSGLVTVHLACESLRRGECALALVPAVNLDVLPESALAVARFGALSPSGRCHTFDARADGYVRGEGGGVVVLKRLSRAIADGDRIHAVIRGSAVNNDGASNGMTAPNPQAQEALLREAYRRAGVDPRDVDAVEAHGTGTRLGDPIEARALGAVFGPGRPAERPLWIGSVKTNIGHLEGAAGIAGLLKAVLSLRHGALPPSLHFEEPSPLIPFAELGLAVPTTLRALGSEERRAIVGVSSFGLGGTNAHVVVEAWPQPLARAAARAAQASEGAASAGEGRGVVFVFPGQGAQWPGMGRFLLQSEPVFRATLERCDRHVRELMGFSLIEAMLASGGRSRLDRIEVSLPAIIAFDVAMAELWRSRGVEAAAVVGHSTGEIAAAYVAGALELEDTMRVICAYGRAIARLSGRGAMTLWELPWERCAAALAGVEGVFPAIFDSVETTVVAGEPGALAAATRRLQADGIVCRPVSIDVAPHSPLVDELRAGLAEELRGIRPRRSRIPLFSEVTGAEVAGESLDVEHWVRNFGDPALFSRAIDALIARGHRLFVDVGPHPITRRSIELNLRGAGVEGAVLASIVRGDDDGRTLAGSLATLGGRGAVGRARRGRPLLLPISARSPEALAGLARGVAELLERGQVDVEDVVHTASVCRDPLPRRLACVGGEAGALASLLRAAEDAEAPVGLFRGLAGAARPRVVFVFPGQGSQWVGMGRRLDDEEPVFHAALAACDEAIAAEAGFSVLAEVRSEAPRLDAIDVVQPLLFAIEVALAALWRSWGVEPAAVIGHSMGEVAAATVAGAISLADAAAVIVRRSELLRELSGTGAMAMVEATVDEAAGAIAGREDRLSVAVSNGPRSTVIAGEPTALDEVLAELTAAGVFCRRVKVDVASHSPQMDPLCPRVAAALAEVAPVAASVPIRSTVTGTTLRGDEMVADYWVDNLRRPVLFSTAVQALLAEGSAVFIEMSPHPILVPAIEENLAARGVDGCALASLRRGQDERTCLLESLAQVYVRGVDVDLARVSPAGGRRVELPAYPWQRERCWLDGEGVRARRTGPQKAEGRAAGHPLLGAAIAVSTRAGERIWEQAIGLEALPYLGDHRVDGEAVVPGAAYIEAATAAASEVLGAATTIVLERLSFDHLLGLPASGARQVQVVLNVRGGEGGTFQIASGEGGQWTRHASGEVRRGSGEAPVLEAPGRLAEGMRAADPAAHYRRMRELRIEYGPAFSLITGLWIGEGAALGRVRLPSGERDDGYRLHPAWLDACLQVSAGLLIPEGASEPYVPVGASRVSVYGRPEGEAWVLARPAGAQAGGADERAADLWVLDAEGRVLVGVEGLRARRLASARGDVDALAGTLHEVVFRPAAAATASLQPGGVWLVYADRRGVAGALVERLVAHGQRCVRVIAGDEFRGREVDLYEIDAAEPEHHARLLREVLGDEGRCRGLVHLWSLDAAEFEASDLASLGADFERGCLSATLAAQAVIRHGFRDPPRLHFITRGVQAIGEGDAVSVSQAPLLGLGRTIVCEHPELRAKCVDLSPSVPSSEIDRLLDEVASTDREEVVALRGAARHVARLVRGDLRDPGERAAAREPAGGRPFALAIAPPGTLDALELREVAAPVPGPGEVVIEVAFAGLNFRDVLVALGALPADGGAEGPALGHECSGRIVAVGEGVSDVAIGDEVVAVAARSFASRVVARRELVAPRPAGLSWEEAAGAPIAFMTAVVALEHVARLRAGERVLIHAAAGGVGLAAVQLALRAGAEVFATAGSEEKRAHLRALGVAHALDSRSLAFADEIRRITDGEGVDVVLNSLAGPFIEASLGLLREFGRFVEIGKRDVLEDRRIGLLPFARGLSYSFVELRAMSERRPAAVGEVLRDVMTRLAAGALTPLPVRVFPASQAVEAFQFVASARHVGKVALAMGEADAAIVPARGGRRMIRGDRSYLVTGGLGGLGLALARSLAEEGAGELVLVGRGGPSEAAQAELAAIERAGARVRCVRADVAEAGDVRALAASLREGSLPLGGVVHAAAILDDHTLLELSPASVRRVLAPKALGAWNLHTLLPAGELEFFVLYSSVAALIGSPGQGNYAAANAFLDALARERSRRGLPGISVQWGAFAEAGLAARLADRGQRLVARGFGGLTPAEGAEALRRLLAAPRPVAGVARFDPRQWVEFNPASAGSPFFAELVGGGGGGASPAAAAARAPRAAIARLAAGERRPALERHLIGEAAAVLRCDRARIDRDAPFRSLGVDSLMSLELRNRLEASLGVRLSATALYTHGCVAALAEHLLPAIGGAADESEAATSAAATSAAATSAAATRAPGVAARAERRAEAADDPVVIVGMACRFPGGGSTPEAFWEALVAGVDGVRRVAGERWPADAVPGGAPATRWAGLLDDVEAFDAAFFGISPREAALLDPQQRLLLEVVWEALERAGLPPGPLVGSRAGVFVGLCNSDYQHLVRRAGTIELYAATGTLGSTAAGRLSYTLGLQGPCMTVDTACSSSLTAVHLAEESLRRGECELAIAAGVNLILDPAGMALVAATQALAADGRCRTFDAAATGVVRGEGCGALVLRRRSAAERDGDPILAVLRGSAMTQDGRSSGLTAPNVLAQEAMLRAALAGSGLAPEEIDYVETHGTGTSLGDPIEFEALRAVFGGARRDGSAFVLGALKPNIGHLESAAGIAGLIKAALCLEHATIPGNLNFSTLNPRMSLDQTPFVIPTEATPWPSSGRPRRAGVSSFGISGTNVHVILEAPPEPPESPADAGSRVLLPLSARTPAALVALARAFAEHLERSSASLRDIAFTASVRRGHHEHRIAALGATRGELARALRMYAEGRPGAAILSAASGAPAGGVDGEDELEALGRRYVAGADVEWRGVFPEGGRVVALPTYPWQRSRHWFSASMPSEPSEPSEAPAAGGDVEAIVHAEVARVLRLAPSQLPRDVPFSALGMDSLMSLELRNRIEARIERRISAASLAAHPSVSALAAFLRRGPALTSSSSAAGEGRGPRERSILLTGATGFLGAHLLGCLLRSPATEVHCLVRASDREAAMRRLRSTMRHYCGELEVEWSRVVPVIGDLAEPRLGLDEDRFAALADRVAAVYHNGAMLDFILPFERLEPANVGGTRAVVELARRSGRARLVHVSSVGVLPEGHPRGPAGLAEVAVGEGGRTLIPCGYTETKRAAEALVSAAIREGLPGIIARPSVVAGSSRSGAWNLDDAMCRIIKGCIQAGAAPEIEWWPDLVPVDFVAEAIVALGERAKVDGSIFHVTSGAPVPFARIVEVARRRGYHVDWLGYDAWLERLEGEGEGNALGPLTPWIRQARPFVDVRYDRSELTRALAEGAVRCPAIDDALLERYFDAFVRAEFLAPPR